LKYFALVICASLAALALGAPVYAQGRGGRGADGPPPAPKATTPVDLTGYWVSLVTEDWRYRMTLAPKGDTRGVPLNPAGKAFANAWDPATDEAAGEQCRAYGAAGIMRMPGRLHITWQDDYTLRLDIDAGTQTRILGFNPAQAKGGDWQGVSLASWDRPRSRMAAAGPGFFAAQGDWGGGLKVVTTKMKPGYLRRNGVPYSANAVLTEYYDRFDVPGGETLLVVSAEVDDPTYLILPFWTSTHYKKLKDAAGWNPTPCSAR
jgi:hypothetical protein